MRVALVHDYLDQFGGAERVLLAMGELFPKAPVYTLFYEKSSMERYFPNREVKPSFINTPFLRKSPRHRVLIPILGHVAQTINLGDEYDLILSSSIGFTKGIRHKKGVHISYTHCPLRYAWEPETYLSDLFPKPLIWAGTPAIKYIRWQDKQFSKKPHHLIASSNHIAGKVRNFYGREAAVLNPPVNTDTFYPDPETPQGEYYLAFGRIIHFKKFPLTVRTFAKLGLPLKVAGVGPDLGQVKKLGKADNIEILNEYRDDAALRGLISGAKAVIVPQVEDFGLVTAEAIACGTPVIGYNEGGTSEIIQDGINGVLFDEQSENGLAEAVRRFETMSFNRGEVAGTAQRFNKDGFKTKLAELIDSATNGVYGVSATLSRARRNRSPRPAYANT